MLALTVVLVAAADGIDEHDLQEMLFGALLDTSPTDLLRQAVLVGVAVLVALVFHRALLVLTFDEVQARLMGMRPRLTELAFLLLVALSVTASFNAVGSLLVFAFLVAPPAAAAMLVRRVPAMMATSALIGTGSVLLGALLAHHLLGTTGHLHGGSPVGVGHPSPEEVAMPATMALVAVAVVLVVMVVVLVLVMLMVVVLVVMVSVVVLVMLVVVLVVLILVVLILFMIEKKRST